MKKIIITLFALLTLANLNALPLQDVLDNKTLSQEIKSALQKQIKENNKSYTIAGLLYTGEATLTQTNNSALFSLIQNKGYITYSLTADKSFNSYTLTIDYNKNNEYRADPHRTNFYNVILTLFKDDKIVQKQLVGVIELRNAGLNTEGTFYTNLAVNAMFINGKFYVLDEEPDTCGKQFNVTGEKIFRPIYETKTIVNHTPDCQDPNHCSCPTEIVTAKQNYVPTYDKKVFVIETATCKTNKTCRCPEYIIQK